MANVYVVSGVNSTEYVNTKREAMSLRPGGDLPEKIEVRDAAELCASLHRYGDQVEAEVNKLRFLLTNLYDVAITFRDSGAGKDALAEIRRFDPEAVKSMSTRMILWGNPAGAG